MAKNILNHSLLLSWGVLRNFFWLFSLLFLQKMLSNLKIHYLPLWLGVNCLLLLPSLHKYLGLVIIVYRSLAATTGTFNIFWVIFNTSQVLVLTWPYCLVQGKGLLLKVWYSWSMLYVSKCSYCYETHVLLALVVWNGIYINMACCKNSWTIKSWKLWCLSFGHVEVLSYFCDYSIITNSLENFMNNVTYLV